MSVTHVPCRMRRAFSLPDLFWLLFMILLLAAILLPSLARARELAKRAVCAANLRGMAQGMHIYANDNDDWFPHHYYEPTYDTGKRPPEHGVRWVGTMGSNEFLTVMERTSPTRSPTRNHPSRSLFLLYIGGNMDRRGFVCPSSADIVDDMRNCVDDTVRAAQPGVSRFDFLGYHCLSYGYQLPYGPSARPHRSLDPRVAIAADKGPYYEPDGPGLPRSGTIRDRRSGVDAPREWSDREATAIVQIPTQHWREWNSRNHRGEGQNVAFVDSHVAFVKRPIAGVQHDNIYTLQSNFDRHACLIGMVPGADEPRGPLTNTDSFLVP